jgi:membrane protein implicated in regulation of membrane protease activity
MGIGSGIALFVIGAILYFALHVQVGFVDISTVGLILMVAGVVLFLVALLLTLRGRRAVSTTADSRGGRTVRQTTERDPYL